MGTQRHEKAILSLLDLLQTAIEGTKLVYTETLIFPGHDLGNGDDFLIEVDPTYRARVLAVGGYQVTEAIASAPTLAFGASGGDTDAYVDDMAGPATSVATNATTDSDASVDFERLMLPGVVRTIPASQLVVGLGTDPGAATGIFTIAVTIGYFA